MSTDGALNCWNTRSGGARVWGVNLYEKYNVPRRPQATRRPGTQRDYGMTASPMVYGDWIIAEIGSEQGSLVALSRKTGEQAWLSEAKGAAGHSGGVVPMTVEGVPCAVALTMKGLEVVRLDGANAGKTAAEYPWVTDFDTNIATPVVSGDSVVITSSYNHQAITRVKVTLSGATKVWEQRRFGLVCSPVIHKGCVYVATHGLICLDWNTGDIKWEGGRYGDAASVLATGDDRLIVWANDGDVGLAESAVRSPTDYKELAFKNGIGKAEAWPHVVLAGGRLYCKDRAGNLTCFKLGTGL
jgi:outer membrane protein assembly factor BamB